MRFALFAFLICCSDAGFAQQAPAPFTDWRASLDNDLSKVSMPRDAHAAIFSILQAYERQAQAQAAKTQPPQDGQRQGN
jgi:hypothetical protein